MEEELEIIMRLSQNQSEAEILALRNTRKDIRKVLDKSLQIPKNKGHVSSNTGR